MSTTTALSIASTFQSDIGSALTTYIPTILAIAGGLLLLGFVWRHVKGKVTGKKF